MKTQAALKSTVSALITLEYETFDVSLRFYACVSQTDEF